MKSAAQRLREMRSKTPYTDYFARLNQTLYQQNPSLGQLTFGPGYMAASATAGSIITTSTPLEIFGNQTITFPNTNSTIIFSEAKLSAKESNSNWLDRRVNEMRVRL